MQIGVQIMVDIVAGDFKSTEEFWGWWSCLKPEEKLKLIDEAHHAEIVHERVWKS